MRHGFRLIGVVLGVLALQSSTASAYVYWSNFGIGFMGGGTTLARANLDAGGHRDPLVRGASYPMGIAVDAHHIFWANEFSNSIARANLDGTGVSQNFVPNAATVGAHPGPVAVATDGTYVYWADNAQYVGRVKVDGTDIQRHWLSFGLNSGPNAVAVDQSRLYILVALQSIYSVPLSGGNPPSIFYTPPNATSLFALAVGGGYVYWAGLTNTNDGEIGRKQATGAAAPQDSFITGLSLPSGIATDGNTLYWADNKKAQIGRATLTTGGATDIRTDFISVPSGPWGVAVDGLIDPTQTTVTCAPSIIAPGRATACTASVHDSASTAPATGTVTFSSDGATFFSPSSCTLSAHADGVSSCTAGAVSPNAGRISIGASYGGDPVHHPSLGATTFCAGSLPQCGVKPPCIVPRLKGRTLNQARTLLTRAHCSLGHVHKPKHGKKLVVSGVTPKPGTRLAYRAKVGLRLAPRKKRR